MPATKTRRCRCSEPHASYSDFADKHWKEAEWISGDGPYALLAHCGVLTVTLHPTERKAEESKALIDRTGCGSGCGRRHEIVWIHLQGVKEKAA